MKAQYTVKTSTQDYPAARFRDANTLANMLESEGIKFGIWSNLAGEWVDDKRPEAAVAPLAEMPARGTAKRRAVKCEASNYKIMQNGIYLSGYAWIIDATDHRAVADDGICSHCGKRVKMRRVGNVGLIPAHNVPDEKLR